MPKTIIKPFKGIYQHAGSNSSLETSLTSPAGRRKSGYASFHSTALFNEHKNNEDFKGKKIVVDKAIYYRTHSNGDVSNSWVSAYLTTSTNYPPGAVNKGDCGGNSISKTSGVEYSFIFGATARKNLATYLSNGTVFGVKTGSTAVGLVYFATGTPRIEIEWHYDYSSASEKTPINNFVGTERQINIKALDLNYNYRVKWGFLENDNYIYCEDFTDLNSKNFSQDSDGYYIIPAKYNFLLKNGKINPTIFKYFPADKNENILTVRVETYSSSDFESANLLGYYDVKITLELREGDGLPVWEGTNIFCNSPISIDEDSEILKNNTQLFLTEITGIKLINGNGGAKIKAYAPAKITSAEIKIFHKTKDGAEEILINKKYSSFKITEKDEYNICQIKDSTLLSKINLDSISENINKKEFSTQITFIDSRGKTTTIIKDKNIIIKKYERPKIKFNFFRGTEDNKLDDVMGENLIGDMEVIYSPVTFSETEDSEKNEILEYVDIEGDKNFTSFLSLIYTPENSGLIERNICFTPESLTEETIEINGIDSKIKKTIEEEKGSYASLLHLKRSIFSFQESIGTKEETLPLNISINQIRIDATIKDCFVTSRATFEIPASNFILFFGKNGKNLGVGGPPKDNDENIVRFHWPIELNDSLNTSEGGTGVSSIQGLGMQLFSTMIDLLYPIGTIYFTVTSGNPGKDGGVFYGTGTKWEAWGAGRVPVGVDTSNANFKTVEKKAGSADAVVVQHSHHPAGFKDTDEHPYRFTIMRSLSATETAVQKQIAKGSDYYAFTSTNSDSLGTDVTTESTGVEGKDKNLQPYITCYMWKRIP